MLLINEISRVGLIESRLRILVAKLESNYSITLAHIHTKAYTPKHEGLVLNSFMILKIYFFISQNYIYLDPSLYFTHFASQIIQASNFHLHEIKQIRKFLPFNTALALTIFLVLSRLDYCNYPFFRTVSFLSCNLFKIALPKFFSKPTTTLHLMLALTAFIGCRSH